MDLNLHVWLHEATEPQLAAGIRRIEVQLGEIKEMNARELAVLGRIDTATTGIGTDLDTIAGEIRDLKTGNNSDLDDALEAKAAAIEAIGTRSKAIATPSDPTPGVAELVQVPGASTAGTQSS